MSDFESDFMDEEYEDYEYSEDESEKQSTGPSQPSQLHTQATFTSDGGFDDDDEDFFDDGGDFEPILNGLKKKKPWEVEFAVYNPHDLQEKQEAIVSRLEPMLALSRDTTALLLHEFLWKEDPLLESFLMDRDRTLARVGLPESPSGPPQLETGDESFTCEVCFCGGASEQFLRLGCGHRFCSDCYTTYVSGKVLEGESWRIRCAAPKCTVLVGLDAAQLLLHGKPELERYKENLTRSFVKELSTMAWCPAPNCEYAVECQVPQAAWSYSIPTVHCRCGTSFCFGCRLEDHVPAPCDLVARWVQKCKDDSETSNWIKANTKECIKCKSTIEKNGGCNHMTCRECRHEFCWVCMGPWNEHGQSFYSCNRFDEDSSKNARDSVSKSRAMLERYLHYFTRFNNHEQSAKLARKLLAATEKNMEQIQREHTMSWIEVQFLSDAVDVLSMCRSTLKWSYVLGYYMVSDNQKIIFENNQSDLEMATEHLNELVENPISEDGPSIEEFKRMVIDKSTYVRSRWETILADIIAGLQENRWQFSAE
ncbi:hypothetical protein LPJ78_005778 [Coemansia sp. RSA 989]|nr:hypothetical protein BX667DRAFT_515628 [Coemansia mojavensis]KAJ1738167.1 hypothetical protein LPJ68_005776 [Coemansia sp. RSA 1086]KAJ1746987.1 hypothetical protein LPJ79_005559 [Coemansia sp. RSA 1821]KAJ1860572.1 hypothetical protein LPJ78_005778 [Coemansia sp. RSA 989]KAJ1870548.1 hypothetical protein LPJ55_004576 [Coemansia sp. RSA 990]KAJ2630408.1 hypothetical protein H4R22_002694 [Coemansia sp. RSA 1290]KAJ2653686.1 hypothetical protein IWW40_000381 [Coemansia sp. RSA 1250]